MYVVPPPTGADAAVEDWAGAEATVEEGATTGDEAGGAATDDELGARIIDELVVGPSLGDEDAVGTPPAEVATAVAVGPTARGGAAMEELE